jgi:MtfA peptidase
MKAMIAGSAIQLTFGYPDIYFVHFWRILNYPDNYYSTITRRYHKGEVNRRELIVLSWKSFREGFADPSDSRNLGYHEMAHALRLINIVANEEYDFYDQDTMNEFEDEANLEIKKIPVRHGVRQFSENIQLRIWMSFLLFQWSAFLSRRLSSGNIIQNSIHC